MVHFMTSKEFGKNPSVAKKSALDGPVVITEQGQRSHVLLSAEAYDRMTRHEILVGDYLWIDDSSNLKLEIPPRAVEERNIDL